VAIVSWALPFVLLAVVLALTIAGVSLPTAWPELLTGLLLIASYVLFWSGAAILALSRLPSAAGGIATLAGVWVLLTLGLPLGVAILASVLDPSPSPSSRVDILRRTTDDVQANRDQILSKAFTERPELRDVIDRVASIDHATRLTFLAPEIERRIAPINRAIADHADRQAGMAVIAGYALPSLGFGAALARLAGTDAGRQHDFVLQARDYQLGLRDYLYPLVQREIGRQSPEAAVPLRGRFNFAGQSSVSRFFFKSEPPSARVISVLPLVLWLFSLGAVIGFLGLRRAARWPADGV
jgi:ABC-2 type transport system permease protein